MKMKPTVYLDTTIPSYLFDERETLKLHIEVTQKWWNQELNNFDTWISEETFNEVSAGNYPKRNEMLNFISNLSILLLIHALLILRKFISIII